MSVQYSDLPNFGDKYLQVFDPYGKSFHLRRRSRAAGNLSLIEAMELIAVLLRRYQMSFLPNKDDGSLVLFPFLFREPVIGDKIKNVTTGEVYTVLQVPRNPETKNWDGVLKLNLNTPPSIESRHKLEYLNFDRYINFDHELPSSIPNQVSANSEEIQRNPPPMSPTITWSLRTVEPGSFGQAFSKDKQLKPVLRESTKDPYVQGYSVEIYGQWYDNLVQFSSWSHDHRTSERLIRWFEQFLKLYTASLRYNGVQQMFFWQRNADSVITTWRQYYAVRDTQWYFRTEELEAVYQRDILKVDLSIGTYSGDTFPRYAENEIQYIADQKISGDYTPTQYRNLFYNSSGEYLFGDVELRQ